MTPKDKKKLLRKQDHLAQKRHDELLAAIDRVHTAIHGTHFNTVHHFDAVSSLLRAVIDAKPEMQKTKVPELLGKKKSRPYRYPTSFDNGKRR